MNQIRITDPELLAQLRALKTADVVDADGKVVGRVVFQKITYPELNITDEELAAIENDPNAERFTTEQVIAHLLRHQRKAS